MLASPLILLALVTLPAASPRAVQFTPDPNPRVRADSLSAEQIDALVLLGKVWGYAKYHHPHVTSGRARWDDELRRIIPVVLSARGEHAGRDAIAGWLAGVGEPLPETCRRRCALAPDGVHLRPDIDWIRDAPSLGPELSRLLVRIHRHRPTGTSHHVSFMPNVGNPVFENESAYEDEPLPAADLRLLALYRFWNIIEYWFPYRDLIEEEWDAVLREFIPRFWRADDRDRYQLEVMQLIARVHDTHANLWSSLAVRPPRGTHRLPVTLRFIEGKAVVTGFAHDTLGPMSGLRIGDVITTIDGAPIDSLVLAWEPYYAASNQSTRLRDIARALPQGPPGRAALTGERGGKPLTITVARVRSDSLDPRAGRTHDRPGPAFQMLAPDVAYLKLSSVELARSASYVQQAQGAKVLVIDIRNYPSEFVVFSIGSLLVPQRTPFARFTVADLSNPGAFTFMPSVMLQPAEPRFEGTVVILVDEASQSQAEYTAMAFRAAPGAIVVGSTTAGADGNVSAIPLPGGLRGMISGIGVFYPDNRPTQRIGILPDLAVRPTIAGIRAGRDEVLEAGVSRALGREFRLDPYRSR